MNRRESERKHTYTRTYTRANVNLYRHVSLRTRMLRAWDERIISQLRYINDKRFASLTNFLSIEAHSKRRIFFSIELVLEPVRLQITHGVRFIRHVTSTEHVSQSFLSSYEIFRSIDRFDYQVCTYTFLSLGRFVTRKGNGVTSSSGIYG